MSEGGKERHFRPAVSMGLKYDLWIGPHSLRLKQGLRSLEVPLADIVHYGIKRVPGQARGLTELRLVTGAKVHKLPFHTGDDEAHRALAHLQELRPDGDVSALPWGEAAQLIGMKPFGFAAVVTHPIAAAGIALFVLAPVAMAIINAVVPPSVLDPETRPIAMVIVMGGGLVAFLVGWRKVRRAQAADQARTRGEAAGPPR